MTHHFANCSLNTERHELTRDGQLIHVEPQVFDILKLLVRRTGKLVTRDELIEIVWGGLIVSESTINARINAARSAVGDTGKDKQIIQTVPRRGIRLIAQIATSDISKTGEGPVSGNIQQEIRYTTSADGLKIAYAVSGDGPPLVRVGHWLSHLELDRQSPVWRPLLESLGAHHSIYRYDQRGTGLSGREFAGKGIDEFVDDLEAVADVCNLHKFPVFAASQAVPVAVKFAAKFPERVSKMVLYGGFAEGRAYRDHLPNDVEEETVLALIRAGWGVNGSTFVKAFSALFMPDATPEQIDDFVKIQLESISPDNAAKLRQLIDRFHVGDMLSEIQCPTLVVHARSDVIQPIEQSQTLAAGIPNARFVMLDSANHVPLPQDPAWKVLTAEIENFLASD